MNIANSLPLWFSIQQENYFVLGFVDDRIKKQRVCVFSGVPSRSPIVSPFVTVSFSFSYYPWFEVFYSILNHVAQLIQLKVVSDDRSIPSFIDCLEYRPRRLFLLVVHVSCDVQR